MPSESASLLRVPECRKCMTSPFVVELARALRLF
jgi:hypothetical protein